MITTLKRQFTLTEERLNLLRQEGATEEDLQLLREAADPVLWAETYLMDPDRGKETFLCKDQFKDILRDPALNRAARVGRQQGKCESAHTHIQMADGAWPTAEELYATVGEGGTFDILSTDPVSLKHCRAQASITDNGVQALVRVMSQSGFVTTNTDNHPYLAWRDTFQTPLWIKGKDLKRGDRIALTRDLRACAVSRDLSRLLPEEAELLGYLTGDDGTSQHTITVTTANRELVTRMNDILDFLHTGMQMQCVQAQGTDKHTFTSRDGASYRKGPGNTSWITDFVRTHGLREVLSKNKKVPRAVFASSNTAIAAFLGAYVSADGWIRAEQSRDYSEIGMASMSEELIYGLRTLFLRLGIVSRVCRKNIAYNGKTKQAWRLTIRDARSVSAFIESIPLIHKKKSESLSLVMHKKQARATETIPRGVWRSYQKLFNKSDIMWDTVKEIKQIGIGQTYAITVYTSHNLITDNFITHNTVHMCVDIMHTGGTTSDAVILIFVPEKKNMNRMLEIMNNFLRGSPLRQSFRMATKKTVKESLEPEYDYEIKISTGSVVRFFFMSQKPDKARGQAATHIYIDEAEYLPAKAWPVIDGIVKGNPSIPIWASSTPSGLEDTWFRNFCDTCSDPKNKRGSEYHLPSTLEKNWKEIEERLRDLIHDEVTWKLEVLAEWTEAKGAVYKKEIIDAALQRSSIAGKYISLDDLRATLEYERGLKCLGVDWNNPQNGVRLVEICVMFGNPWVTRHETIAYKEYTQLSAVNRILDLYKQCRYDVISVDAGYGHTQVELLQKQLPFLDAEPARVLNVVDSATKEKMIIEYHSPETGSRRRNTINVRTKTKIVGLVGKYLENDLVIPLCEDEYREGLVKEIRNFRRKSQHRDGGFEYTNNTHSLSALQFCLHGYDKIITERHLKASPAYQNMSYGNLVEVVTVSQQVRHNEISTRIVTGTVGLRNTRGSRTGGLPYGGKRRTIL